MGPGGFKPGVGRWQSFPDPWKFSRGEKQKENFFQPLKSCFFEICQLEGSPIANALWATGKAPEKFTACYHGCLEGKIKPEKLFFEICQLEGSPIAIALWAAGKAPEKLTACYHGCLDGKIKKQLFSLWNCFFEICQLEGSPIAIALWAAGKEPENLPAITGVWTGKSKNNFSGSESCFLKFASWKGLPLQLRFGQLEKHLKSSLLLSRVSGRENQKTPFQARLSKIVFWNLPVVRVFHCNCALGSWKSTWKAHCLLSRVSGGENQKTTLQPLKSCFFWNLPVGRVPHCNCALGSWKRTWKAHCLLSRVSGRENQKNNFSGSEKLFFEICQLEGSPIAIALWAAGKAPEKLTACYHGVSGRENQKNNFSGFEKLFFEICQLEGSPISIALWNVCPVYIVGTGICCCHCVAASFHTDLTKSPRLNSKTYLAPRLSSL